MNPQMFNSFLDGTKSAIEMAAVANATGLAAPEDGLAFPPCGVDDLPHVLRPRAAGGQLDHARAGRGGLLARARRPAGVPRPALGRLRRVRGADATTLPRCFAEYGLVTDPSGRYAAMYKPVPPDRAGARHLASRRAGLRGEPTGSATGLRGDVVATAKRDLAAGEMLDGEGGYCVYGRLVPARRAHAERLLPIGFAQRVRLRRPVAADQLLALADVELDLDHPAARLRAELRPLP